MSGRHWIVCAVWDREAVADDEWHAFDTEAAARAAYDNVIENGAATASLCAVIQSTDYEPHPAYDFGDLCVSCGEDTSAGSGRYVNRIPATGTVEVTVPNSIYSLDLEVSGYMCCNCQDSSAGDPCDICGADLLEGICTCDPADVATWPLEEGD